MFSCCGAEMVAALKASAVILSCEHGIVIERTSWVVTCSKIKFVLSVWGIRELGSCDSCLSNRISSGLSHLLIGEGRIIQ